MDVQPKKEALLKQYMARDGGFKDVDTAISWHPATYNSVNKPNSLANIRIDFTFFGKAAHAAIAPHLGRSALDAIELMNVGVNYMREHIACICKNSLCIHRCWWKCSQCCSS